MRILLASAGALALLGLAACNGAQNEAATVNETVSGDSNTMGEAVSDVDAANAAMDNAFAAAENSYADNGAAESGEASNEITD